MTATQKEGDPHSWNKSLRALKESALHTQIVRFFKQPPQTRFPSISSSFSLLNATPLNGYTYRFKIKNYVRNHTLALPESCIPPEFFGLSHPHRHLKLSSRFTAIRAVERIVTRAPWAWESACAQPWKLSSRWRGALFLFSVRVFVQATNIQHWRKTKVTDVLLSMLQEKEEDS